MLHFREIHVGLTTKKGNYSGLAVYLTLTGFETLSGFTNGEQLPTKSAKGDPAALQLTGENLKDFSGEEAPEARAGPRSRRSR